MYCKKYSVSFKTYSKELQPSGEAAANREELIEGEGNHIDAGWERHPIGELLLPPLCSRPSPLVRMHQVGKSRARRRRWWPGAPLHGGGGRVWPVVAARSPSASPGRIWWWGRNMGSKPRGRGEKEVGSGRARAPVTKEVGSARWG